jgi:hypothetical protein
VKLRGPRGIRIRVEFNPERSRAVVTGVFPPEHAARYRTVWQRLVDGAQPKMRATYEEAMAKMTHTMIYGDPDAPEPVGVLRGVSPMRDIARQLGLA